MITASRGRRRRRGRSGVSSFGAVEVERRRGQRRVEGLEGIKEEAEGEAEEGGTERRAWQPDCCGRRHDAESGAVSTRVWDRLFVLVVCACITGRRSLLQVVVATGEGGERAGWERALLNCGDDGKDNDRNR